MEKKFEESLKELLEGNNNEIKKVYCYFEINLKNEKCCICFDKQKKNEYEKEIMKVSEEVLKLIMNNGSKENFNSMKEKQSNTLKRDNSFEQKQQNINNLLLAKIKNDRKNISKICSKDLKSNTSLKQINSNNSKMNNFQRTQKDLEKMLSNQTDSFCDNLKKSAKGEPCISKYIEGKYYLFLGSSEVIVKIRKFTPEKKGEIEEKNKGGRQKF